MAASREAGVAFVQAPSGLTGFLLLTRLPGLPSHNRQDARGRWSVRVSVSDAAAVRTLLERVQLWLRQERLAETRVSVGNDVYRVRANGAELELPDTTSVRNRRELGTMLANGGCEQAYASGRSDRA
jgi:hypothetical protein